MNDEKRVLAVFIDFESLALGFKQHENGFDVNRVLARLVEKGDIVAKRAYADWHRFSPCTAALHEAAVELIELPRRIASGKNSADIRLCVDAMDLCYSKSHINTFAIVSGDSDFSPLVSKLKENGKQVVGLGMRESTSNLLRDNCHEFIYYEDLKTDGEESALVLQAENGREKELFRLLLESLQALRRENRDTLWSSLVKETMKRKQPSFSEAAYGYKSFSRLLEDAARRGLIEIARDAADRTYIITRFGAELAGTDNRPETRVGSRNSKRRPARAAASAGARPKAPR